LSTPNFVHIINIYIYSYLILLCFISSFYLILFSIYFYSYFIYFYFVFNFLHIYFLLFYYLRKKRKKESDLKKKAHKKVKQKNNKEESRENIKIQKTKERNKEPNLFSLFNGLIVHYYVYTLMFASICTLAISLSFRK